MSEGGFTRRDLFRRLGARARDAAESKIPELPRFPPLSPPAGSVPRGASPSAPADSPRSPARAFPLHRPPGAIAEAEFLAACTKCGECIEACPHDAIALSSSRLRVGARTPVIQPLGAPCRMCPDTPCIAACAPRALRKEQPLRMAEARIQPWACLAHQGTFCSVCREQCPVPGAIEVEAGKPRIIESICTGCGVCQHVCPAPENAVLVMPLAERKTIAKTQPGTDSGAPSTTAVPSSSPPSPAEPPQP